MPLPMASPYSGYSSIDSLSAAPHARMPPRAAYQPPSERRSAGRRGQVRSGRAHSPLSTACLSRCECSCFARAGAPTTSRGSTGRWCGAGRRGPTCSWCRRGRACPCSGLPAATPSRCRSRPLPAVTGWVRAGPRQHLFLTGGRGQLHYDNARGRAGVVDRTGVRVYYTAPRGADAGVMQVGDPTVSLRGQALPAGLSRQSFACAGLTAGFADAAVAVFMRGLHMHRSGRRMVSRQYRAKVRPTPPAHRRAAGRPPLAPPPMQQGAAAGRRRRRAARRGQARVTGATGAGR